MKQAAKAFTARALGTIAVLLSMTTAGFAEDISLLCRFTDYCNPGKACNTASGTDSSAGHLIVNVQEHYVVDGAKRLAATVTPTAIEWTYDDGSGPSPNHVRARLDRATLIEADSIYGPDDSLIIINEYACRKVTNQI